MGEIRWCGSVYEIFCQANFKTILKYLFSGFLRLTSGGRRLGIIVNEEFLEIFCEKKIYSNLSRK